MIKTVKILSIRTSNRCPETFKTFKEGLGLYKVDPGLCEEGEDDGVGGQRTNDSIKTLKERRTFLIKKNDSNVWTFHTLMQQRGRINMN